MAEAPPDNAKATSLYQRIDRLILPPDFAPERSADTLTRVEAIFEPIALVTVVICFVLSILQFGVALFPNWSTQFVVPLLILVAIEGFFYSRRLTHSVFRPKEWLVLLALPIVLMRFLPNLGVAGSGDSLDVISWLSKPAEVLTASFVIESLLILLVWCVVVGCTQLLNGVRVQPGEIIQETNLQRRRFLEDNWRAVDHSAPLRVLGELFAYGCMILVFLSAMASLGTDQFASIEAIGQIIGFARPSVHLVLANVVGFVVVGLLLLGEAHYVRQRTLWRIDRLSVPLAVSASWGLGLAGLVGIALAIAFILPTSYAMTLGEVVSTILFAIAQLVLLVLGLFIFIIATIGSLLGVSAKPDSPTQAARQPRLNPVAPPPAGGSLMDTIQSIVFWLVVLAIVGYSIYVIWRRRPAWAIRFPLQRWLAAPWNFFRSFFRLIRRVGVDVGRAVIAAIPRILRAPPAQRPRVPGFLSLSRLGPRELVEYYYLSVCERAARLGYPRPPDETPDEYLLELRAHLPIVDPEIETLTAAFLEARYGPRPTTSERVKQLRGGWEALKKKLRSTRLRRAKGI